MKSVTANIKGDGNAQVPSHVKMTLIVILGLLLAWYLQIHQLQTNALWADEVASYNRATIASWDGVRQAYVESGHTLLYEQGILRNWLRVVGEGNLLSRIPTIFLGILTLALTYALGQRVTTRKVAVTAVFLIAISPLFLRHAREARPYLLMSLTTMIALYMWLRALQTENWRYWIGFTIGGVLMVYTHYYDLLVLLAIGIMTLVYIWHTKSTYLLRPFSISVFVIAILFLPWFPVFLAAYEYGSIEWIAPVTYIQVYFLPTTFINHVDVPQHLSAGSGSLMIGLLIWIFATMARLRPKWLLYLMGIAFLTVALSVIVSILLTPMFIARYFMGIVPIFALMLSWGIWYLRPRWLVGLMYMPLFILMLLSTYQLVTLQSESSWEDAIAYVQENAEPTDAILIVSPETWTIKSFYYYCRDCKIAVYDERGSLENEELVNTWLQQYAQYDRIWFIQSARSLSAHGASLHPQSEYAGYTLQDRVSFERDLISSRLSLELWLLTTE